MNNYLIDLPVSEKYDSSDNILRVSKSTNQSLYEEVYTFAKYFKEELNYDRVPFCKMGMLDKPYNVLLFTEQALDQYYGDPMPYRIYGACLFSEMKIADELHHKLEWIWFHPFFRNRGNLKKNWFRLEKEFGDFFIGKPISNDMKIFLENIKSEYKHIQISM